MTEQPPGRKEKAAPVIRDLASKIACGTYGPGRKIPSLRKLSERYGVSVSTARRSVKALADKGLLTFLHGSGTGKSSEAFGDVAASTGHGNNDSDKRDGVRYKNVVGTYLHGPLLAKNPEVADDLLARALQRFASRTGQPAIELAPLDDAVEQDANDAMVKKLGVHR